MTEGKTMTDETLREWIEKAQFTVTSPTHAPHVNEPIQVVTVEGLLAALTSGDGSESAGLREALAGLFELVETGELVRDISRDSQPDYLRRMVKLTQTLKAAQAALALHPSGHRIKKLEECLDDFLINEECFCTRTQQHPCPRCVVTIEEARELLGDSATPSSVPSDLPQKLDEDPPPQCKYCNQFFPNHLAGCLSAAPAISRPPTQGSLDTPQSGKNDS